MIFDPKGHLIRSDGGSTFAEGSPQQRTAKDQRSQARSNNLPERKQIMMNVILSTITAMMISQPAEAAPNLPELNVIKRVTLDGSYSCDNTKEYGLELVKDVNLIQDADLFLNYACGTRMMFESGYRGAGLSLIADLGPQKLEDLNWMKALSPTWQVGESYNFRKSALVQQGHSYSVVINSRKASGLMVFTVENIDGQRVTIRYAVRQYALNLSTINTPGFDYEAPNKENSDQIDEAPKIKTHGNQEHKNVH